MKRRVVGSIVLVLLTLGWGNRSVGEPVPAPRGELRIVDANMLTFARVTFNVFEHLVESDKDGTWRPGLATAWHWLDDRTLEMTLRRGVTFHNGEVFDAEIVKLNWDETFRSCPPHMLGKFLEFTPGSRLEIIAPYTVRFRFSAPDGAILWKLSGMHMGNRQFFQELGWGQESW